MERGSARVVRCAPLSGAQGEILIRKRQADMRKLSVESLGSLVGYLSLVALSVLTV